MSFYLVSLSGDPMSQKTLCAGCGSVCYGGDLLQSFIVSIQANPSYVPISPSRQGFLKVSVLDGINGIERENTTFSTEAGLTYDL